MIKLGEIISARRVELGMQQKELSIRTGISRTLLSLLERGRMKSVSERVLSLIAKELGLCPDLLMALAGKVSSEIMEIYKKNPLEISTIIRNYHV